MITPKHVILQIGKLYKENKVKEDLYYLKQKQTKWKQRTKTKLETNNQKPQTNKKINSDKQTKQTMHTLST